MVLVAGVLLMVVEVAGATTAGVSEVVVVLLFVTVVSSLSARAKPKPAIAVHSANTGSNGVFIKVKVASHVPIPRTGR